MKSDISDTTLSETILSIVSCYCTATEQPKELEIFVHDTTLHPSGGKEMEQNEMRFSWHVHKKHSF